MWRSAFARHAFRHLNAFQPRIPNVRAIFSTPGNAVQSPSSSTWIASQFPGSFMNPRFFSDEHSHSDSDPISSEPISSNEMQFADEHSHSDPISSEPISSNEMQFAQPDEIDVEKLESVLSLLQSSADGSFESCLNGMDLEPNQEFFMKVTQTPLVLGENLIRFFRWAWMYKSFEVTAPVLESLTLAICTGLKKKVIYSLWDLIKDVNAQGKEVLNVVILNELIVSLSKLGRGKAAFDVFNSFEEFGCVPNAETYYFTIEALCRRSFFDWAWSVSQKMFDAQILPDGEKVGQIISWFCKGRSAKAAHAVYVAAREKKQLPLTSTISNLIGQLSHNNETVELALEMLDDIRGEAKKRAIKPYSAVVQALCRIKDVEAAKQLILKMIADGPPPGNAVFNYVITGYSKAGELGQALEMIKLMETRGLKPDVYSYTVVISGYSNGGEMEQASKVFTEAKKKHSKLSPATYHTLIRGYCKLEQFEKALELLSEMKEFGVRPTADEYEKLIQSLCLKALDWKVAEKLQEEMKENGLHLKGITRALVRAVKEMESEVVETEKGSLAA